MEDSEIDRIAENQKEWRVYMLKKIDKVECELASFKIRVIASACFFGGLSGVGVELIGLIFKSS